VTQRANRRQQVFLGVPTTCFTATSWLRLRDARALKYGPIA
jgi:hypothetical protein